jgi:hypothetical protein
MIISDNNINLSALRTLVNRISHYDYIYYSRHFISIGIYILR